MTASITIKANGPCYPARVTQRNLLGEEVRNQLVAGGTELMIWVGQGETVTVTEEYHPEGYTLS